MPVAEQQIEIPVEEVERQAVIREPGVYQDVSFSDYGSIPALNISTLTWADISAEHLRAALDRKLSWPDSVDKKFGRAVHCRLLEPDRYKSDFLVAAPCGRILKSGERKGQPCGKSASHHLDGVWTCGVHALGDIPRDFVSVEAADEIEQIADKVRNHEVVKLIRQSGGYEATVIGELDGIPSKCRADKLVLNRPKCPNALIDIKKVQVGRGTMEKWGRAMIDYHYHVKAAWYVDLVKAVTGIECVFIWVVIEDSFPFSIGVYEARHDVEIAIGRFIYKRWLKNYQEWTAANRWGGYSTDIQWAELPQFYVKQWGMQ